MNERIKKSTSTRRRDSLSIAARLRPEHSTIIPSLPVTFRYDPEDPFAVRFEFSDPVTGMCSWLIGREQLIEGVLHGIRTTTFSIQEVTVLSSDGAGLGSLLRVTLTGKRLRAVFEMDLDPIRTWLARTLSTVKAGSEGRNVDWDGFLAHLTNG